MAQLTAMQELIAELDRQAENLKGVFAELKPEFFYYEKYKSSIDMINSVKTLATLYQHKEQRQIEVAFEMGAMPIIEDADPKTGQQYYERTFNN